MIDLPDFELLVEMIVAIVHIRCLLTMKLRKYIIDKLPSW